MGLPRHAEYAAAVAKVEAIVSWVLDAEVMRRTNAASLATIVYPFLAASRPARRAP
jgi:hypothetical protein